jgi:hypothetical protein
MRRGRPRYKMGITYSGRTGGGIVVLCGLAPRVTKNRHYLQHGRTKGNVVVCGLADHIIKGTLLKVARLVEE